jgi:hypothetical protein
MDETVHQPGMTVQNWLDNQRQLQVHAYHQDPRFLKGDGRADYGLWNVLALTDELHEALLELKWKPWLTEGRGDWVNRDAFVGELIDAMHFLGNLFLLAGATGSEITERYIQKLALNAHRQEVGYSGDKDDDGRATDDHYATARAEHVRRQNGKV